MLMMMPPLLRHFWFHSIYSRAASCSLQSANVIHRLCFLIVFNYFPFTVFNILASFIYGFNASKALFTQASRFSIKVRRLLQQPTNYVSKLFVLRDLQVFCPLILKSKPHKRHLPSFPDPTGLMGVRGDALSPNLRDCGVLGIVSHCEEFSTTYTPAFSWSFARKPVLWVVSHVRKTSLVVKETPAHAW